MTQKYLNFQNVTFKYASIAEVLFSELNFQVNRGWTGVVGANGSGKSTLLQLACGLLQPFDGQIQRPEIAVYCAQRTDDLPEHFDAFFESYTNAAFKIRDMLHIDDDWLYRWDTLSHGERKRAQIATALWQQPDLLAIDEPTNHLDEDGKLIIRNALKSFTGIGLIISHERDLLDDLVQQCIFVHPPNIILRPGNISQGLEAEQAEQDHRQKQYAAKKQVLQKLKREYIARRSKAAQADAKRSKKNTVRKDHDAREKIDRARITGKDAVDGKLQKQMEGRLNQAEAEFKSIHYKKQSTLGINLPAGRSQRNLLFEIQAGQLALGKSGQLRFPELTILPDSRIAFTGPNGSGKSTLIRHLIQSLNVEKDRLTYIPQEIDLREAESINRRIQDLPNEKLGFLMTVVNRLGSDPKRLLESSSPSPGEIRKLLLALGMTNEPHIIIMDEPTNHLDLPSILCLESALTDVQCALLLVSHDRRFLEKLTTSAWNIKPDKTDHQQFILRTAFTT